MKEENAVDLLKRYLQNSIAAEKSFEMQLRRMAEESEHEAVRKFFREHADETRIQQERLAERLRELGGSFSSAASFMGHILSLASKSHSGQDAVEKNSQDLILAFAVENGEIAMYEELATIAALAGDVETEHLARVLQMEERQAAETVWSLIAPNSTASFSRKTRAA